MEDLPYREEFVRAVEILAQANRELGPDSGKMPIIVGGAAVEFYTSGAFDTGDIDLVAAWPSSAPRT
ncbi:hypothetical protein C882_0084 [Caenispirillum salinarum AK4]|uniref:Uncharacterized protein n=1 Tax=Caenispirillum salinarum AK4 TaxID=1238182 RepID=K9HHT0_9PROT|nr:hypothetical protein [Caenispirillum salinarum]EKV30003.1 hypothetical protein C882_0084 [Caenispirillum salinarum AK4]